MPYLDNESDSAGRVLLHGDGSVEGPITDDQLDILRIRLFAQMIVDFGQFPSGHRISVDLQNLVTESVVAQKRKGKYF